MAQLVARAARKVREPVSEAQAHAGNYRKGHVHMHGMNITIENSKGSVRSGTDSKGKAWSNTMANHYGYVRRTEGRDGDHVDVFLGPNPEGESVYVIDQINPATKKFDAHKVMLGFTSKKDAKNAYHANYAKNWKGFGKMTPLTIDQFRQWLIEGSQWRPIGTQTFKMKKVGSTDSEDDIPILVIHKKATIRLIPPNIAD